MNKLFSKLIIPGLIGSALGASLGFTIDAIVQDRKRPSVVEKLKGSDYEHLNPYQKSHKLCSIYNDEQTKPYQKQVIQEIEDLIKNALSNHDGNWAYGMLFPDGKQSNLSKQLNPDVVKQTGLRQMADIKWIVQSTEDFLITGLDAKYNNLKKNIKLGFDNKYVGENPRTLFVWFGQPDGAPSPDKGYLFISLEQREQAEGRRLRASYKEELEAQDKAALDHAAELKEVKDASNKRLKFYFTEIEKNTNAKQ